MYSLCPAEWPPWYLNINLSCWQKVCVILCSWHHRVAYCHGPTNEYCVCWACHQKKFVCKEPHGKYKLKFCGFLRHGECHHPISSGFMVICFLELSLNNLSTVMLSLYFFIGKTFIDIFTGQESHVVQRVECAIKIFVSKMEAVEQHKIRIFALSFM